MKILIVHQYYLMPGMPGGSRFNELARFWSARGHDVTVIAGNLDYNTGVVPERYRGRWMTEESDGSVRVLRCHVPATYGKSYAGRMWAFAGFTVSALFAVVRAERPDVVVATSPPLVAAIPGILAARIPGRRVPFVFEVRDLWPESAVTTGVLRKGSPLTRALYVLERLACAAADRVNVLTPAFRDDLIARGLAGAEKIVFVPNGADVDAFRPGPRDNAIRRTQGWGERTVFLYAGAHGRANAIGQLVEAAALLRDRPDILVVSVGDGPERERWVREAAARGIRGISFPGPQAKDRMPDWVNAADVGLAVLQHNPTFRTVYPNKVFDYMACERPSIVAIDGVARTLVCEEARAGSFAPPENPEALAAEMIRLADDPGLRAEMGRNGRAWVLANATREALASRYLGVLEGMVARA